MNDAIEVILVEDNSSDIELTTRALKKFNLANRIRILKDGEEALEYLFSSVDSRSNSVPKVILLDLKLPKVDGMEILRQIRADDRTRCIPVVILTSSSEERDRLESYRLGANSYIIKPVGFEDFVRAISKIGFYWLVLNAPPF